MEPLTESTACSVLDNHLNSQLDKHVGDFLAHIDAVLAVHERGQKSRIVNPIKKQFVHFKRAYPLLTDEEKKAVFSNFFSANKSVLTNRKSRQWDKSGAYLYIDPSDISMRVSVSAFWRYATSIVADTNEELRGLPDSAADSRTEFIFPDLIELYLYRALLQVVESPDLSIILTDIETDLGEEITQRNTPPSLDTAARPGMQQGIQGMQGLLGQLGTFAKQLFGGGGDISATAAVGGAAGPGQILEGFTKMLNDKDSMGKLAGVMASFSDTPPDKIMDRFRDLYTDPDLQAMVKTVIDVRIPPEIAGQIVNAINQSGTPAEGDTPFDTSDDGVYVDADSADKGDGAVVVADVANVADVADVANVAVA